MACALERAAAEKRAVPNARPAGDDAAAGLHVYLFERERVLIQERPPFLIRREVRFDRRAELETEKNAPLDPGVHAPAGR